MSAYNEFLQEYNRKSLPINKQMHKNYQAKIQNNRNALAPIVDTIKLCSRRNLPFRGHCDSVTEQPKVGMSGLNNSGNFAELLYYCCYGGDTNLKHHLETTAQNARYTSPEIQNELIDCCGELIIEKIAVIVKESRHYSILADEATDCAMKGQMALILRSVDKNNIIREEFVSFLECRNGLTGVGLYQTINKFLGSVGLDILDCHGQGYDGAGAVAGKDKGLQAQICRVNLKTLYTHCASYRLNLAVVASCKEERIRNVMEQIKEMFNFFNFSVPSKKQFVRES